MEIKIGIPTNLTGAFGPSRTGRTVTVSILDSDGDVVVSGFTISSVLELGSGYYGVQITFSEDFVGYVQWDDADDGLTIFDTILVLPDNSEILRKIETNRWKISSNQLIVYDDDGTTPLYTWNLFDDGVPNGDTPNERVPA